ncbi:MAG: transglycosylase SLT domain-containing protein [Candidatus Eiseniibacteriota bacterium]
MRQAWLRYSCSLLLAATLVVAGASSSSAATPSKKKRSTRSTTSAATAPDDFNAGRALLECQDAFATARKHFSAKRNDEAIDVLDEVIVDLNTAIVSTKDKRIRSSLGDLLRKSGSLKLAAQNARAKTASPGGTAAAAGSTTAPLASSGATSTAGPAANTPVAPDPAATLATESATTTVSGSSSSATPPFAPPTLGPVAPVAPFAPVTPGASDAPAVSAANESTAVASSVPFVPPAPASGIPLKTEEELDEASLAQPAVEDDPNAIAIESHPRVDKWLDYFTGRGRPAFERWLVRSGLYMDWMKGILEREGVPTDLVHLVFVESGFNPHARSYASAVGPWQFIRGTARLFGLTVNSWVDERKDPEASTVAAARYLKHLHGLFNSWPLALASYNAGEGAVINAIKRQGTKDFWSLRLPQQTKDYVPKFMAVLAISRDPARYGFDTVTLEQPMQYDEVTIPGPVDLRALADACAADVETIRLLNPSILRNAAPAKDDQVTIRVPDGSGDKLLASLADGSLQLPKVETPADPIVLRHKVRRGESLKSLSLKYGVSAKKIARYNRIGRKSRLKVGRTILIPQHDAAVRTSRSASKVAASAPSPAAAPGANGTSAPNGTTGTSGTSVAGLADGASVAAGTNEAGVTSAQGGLESGVGVGAGSEDRIENVPATRTIRVRKGQTLSGIAAAHGTTVSELRELNGLSKRSIVKAGQRLKVPRAG